MEINTLRIRSLFLDFFFRIFGSIFYKKAFETDGLGFQFSTSIKIKKACDHEKICFVSCVLPKILLDYPNLAVQEAPVFELPFSLDVCILMRTRNGSRNSNPLVCSFTQNVYTIRGNRTAKKVGVDQNWKFTLWFVSYTCWKSQDFPTPPIQEKREYIYSATKYNRVLILLSLILKIQSVQIVLRVLCNLHEEQKGWKKKRKDFRSNSFSI